MPMYTISTTPLINSLPKDVQQVWYADDASTSGCLHDLRTWWNKLTSLGSAYGYHTNATNCMKDMASHHTTSLPIDSISLQRYSSKNIYRGKTPSRYLYWLQGIFWQVHQGKGGRVEPGAWEVDHHRGNRTSCSLCRHHPRTSKQMDISLPHDPWHKWTPRANHQNETHPRNDRKAPPNDTERELL